MKGNIEKKNELKENNLDADHFLTDLVKKFMTYSEEYVINIRHSSETFDLPFAERDRAD